MAFPWDWTVAGVLLTAITLVPTTLSWLETRRQRRLSEQPSRSDIKPPALSQRWRCGIYDYPPLSVIDAAEPTNPSGPLVNLARDVANSLGHPISFHQFSYEEFGQDATTSPDIIVGMFETNRRAQRMCFSSPLYEIGLQGICRIGQNTENLLEEMRSGKLKIAVYSGEIGWEFAKDDLQDAFDEHRVATLVGGHQMDTTSLLTQGVYDVVMMDALSCFNFLNEGGHRKRFKMAFVKPPKTYSACIALHQKHQNCLAELNATIRDVRNSPAFLRLEQSALTGFEEVIVRRGLQAHHSVGQKH